MPKLLRPDEKISFVQSRAPSEIWRYVKRLAIDHAFDGTATRLCTDYMLQFLSERVWVRQPCLRPLDLKHVDGPTGFQQVNIPLSNMDAEGNIIVSNAYLARHGIADLFNADRHAYRAAVETGDFSKLICVAAAQQQVSAAIVGYTFLHWLAVVKFEPSEQRVMAFDPSALPQATALAKASPEPAPRSRSRSP